MVHDNSDDNTLCVSPLGYREGFSLSGLMPLQSFVEGGYDVADAKILVVVKCVKPMKMGELPYCAGCSSLRAGD